MPQSPPAPRRPPTRRRRQLRRGTYLLPSLFTMGNVMLGFTAVVRAYAGDFWTASLMIIAAGFLDGLDGRIARLTRTESEFGKEFDSLADVVTFGVAPALVAFSWGLHDLGRLGWLVPLFFLLCTAIRLARFNVQTKVVDARQFVGLPSPVAAGIVASLLFAVSTYDATRELWLELVVLVTLATAGTLMVSTFRYPSLKKIDLKQRLSYRAAIVIAAAILVLVYRPAIFFLASATIYVLWGPALWALGRLRRRRGEPAAETLEAS